MRHTFYLRGIILNEYLVAFLHKLFWQDFKYGGTGVEEVLYTVFSILHSLHARLFGRINDARKPIVQGWCKNNGRLNTNITTKYYISV